MLAIAVDPPRRARRVVETSRLAFPILCDTEREAIRKYGVVHKGGGPRNSDIALPAHFLIDTDGRIAWQHIARRNQDRPAPRDVLEHLAQLP